MIISNFGSQASPGKSICQLKEFGGLTRRSIDTIQTTTSPLCTWPSNETAKNANFKTINSRNALVQSCYTFYQGAVKRMPG